MRILVVEDDSGVAGALIGVLQAQGHEVDWVTNGDDALLQHHPADLVLLDLGLPGKDGQEVLRDLRQVSTVPVIVITARGDERSVVRALRSGADDYVVKPPRLIELLARIEAAGRRARPAGGPDNGVLVVSGDVVVNLQARTVSVGEVAAPITSTEFDVIAVLAGRADQAVSRKVIMDVVWGDAFLAVSRSLDVHIGKIRHKLDRPAVLETIRGYGYRWNTTEDAHR